MFGACVGNLPGDLFGRGDREPRLVDGVQVVGPFNSPGVSETASRRRVFVCHPTAADDRACVRRIAEKHGGSVRYAPSSPSGSTFTMTLPAVEE